MGLVLVAVIAFVVIGLSSESLGKRQGALIAFVAVSLAVVQFTFERFL